MRLERAIEIILQGPEHFPGSKTFLQSFIEEDKACHDGCHTQAHKKKPGLRGIGLPDFQDLDRIEGRTPCKRTPQGSHSTTSRFGSRYQGALLGCSSSKGDGDRESQPPITLRHQAGAEPVEGDFFPAVNLDL
jgi:hypothetical protein